MSSTHIPLQTWAIPGRHGFHLKGYTAGEICFPSFLPKQSLLPSDIFKVTLHPSLTSLKWPFTPPELIKGEPCLLLYHPLSKSVSLKGTTTLLCTNVRAPTSRQNSSSCVWGISWKFTCLGPWDLNPDSSHWEPASELARCLFFPSHSPTWGKFLGLGAQV